MSAENTNQPRTIKGASNSIESQIKSVIFDIELDHDNTGKYFVKVLKDETGLLPKRIQGGVSIPVSQSINLLDSPVDTGRTRFSFFSDSIPFRNNTGNSAYRLIAEYDRDDLLVFSIRRFSLTTGDYMNMNSLSTSQRFLLKADLIEGTLPSSYDAEFTAENPQEESPE